MRRIFILAVAFFAIGCSSRASVPVPTKISPNVYQKFFGSRWVATNIPKVNGQPAGPDRMVVDTRNNIWTSDSAGAISKVAMDQSVTSYPVSFLPFDITVGSDQNLWITARSSNGMLARVTPQGVETDYVVAQRSIVLRIIRGQDGALWFTLCGASNGIGTITTSGAFTIFPTAVCPAVIASGSDGNIWFGDNGTDIYSMTTQGVLIGTFHVGDIYFDAVASGPDGALYFGAGLTSGNDELVRVATDGTLTHIGPYPRGLGTTFAGITTGPDGKLWITSSGRGSRHLITFDTASQSYGNTRIDSPAYGQIVLGPDDNLWLANAPNKVYTFEYLALRPTPTSLTIPTGKIANFTVTETKYSGQWTAVSANSSVATVTPNSDGGTFVVTGVAPGTTFVTVDDTIFNSVHVKVTVQ